MKVIAQHWQLNLWLHLLINLLPRGMLSASNYCSEMLGQEYVGFGKWDWQLRGDVSSEAGLIPRTSSLRGQPPALFPTQCRFEHSPWIVWVTLA
jgi:hypothetical protein